MKKAKRWVMWAFIGIGVALVVTVRSLCMLFVLFDEPMQTPYEARYLSDKGYAAVLGAADMKYEAFF